MDNLELLKKVLLDLESSGGKNTDHRPIQEGIHKGHTAVGGHGLMLNTAKEVANRKRLQGQLDELDSRLLKDINTQEDFESFVNQNPAKYDEYVNHLTQRVYERSEGDIPTAATMWRWGHNLPKERAMQLLEKNPEYKQRVLNALKRMKGNE